MEFDQLKSNQMAFSLTMTRDQCIAACIRYRPDAASDILAKAATLLNKEPVVAVYPEHGDVTIEWEDLNAQRATDSTPYDPNFRTKEAAEHPEAETGVPAGQGSD